MTRNGKIGRLPKALRDEVNQRLLDNEDTESLLTWLNQQPKAQAVLKKQFNGTSIDKHNLSEWRLGGYQDWLCREEALEMVQSITEESEEVKQVAGDDMRLSEHLDTVLTARLARSAKALLAEPVEPMEHFKRLERVLGQLNRMRRTNVVVMRELRDEERWDWEQVDRERAIEEWVKKDRKKRRLAPYWAAEDVHMWAATFGGGERGWRIAQHVVAAKYDFPWPPQKVGATWQPEWLVKKEAAEKASREAKDKSRETEGAMAIEGRARGDEGPREERSAAKAMSTEEPGAGDGCATLRKGVSEPATPKAFGATGGPSESVVASSCGGAQRAVNIGEKERVGTAVEGRKDENRTPELKSEGQALPAKASVPKAPTAGVWSAAGEPDAVGRGDMAAAGPADTAALQLSGGPGEVAAGGSGVENEGQTAAATGVQKGDPLAFLEEPWRPGAPVFNQQPENPHVEPLMRQKLVHDENPFRRRRKGHLW